MARALSNKDLAGMLDGLKGAKIERITFIAGSQIALQVRYGGKLLSFTCNILEVFEADLVLKRARIPVESTHALGREHSSKQSWAETELRAQGFPLYWSEEWLKTQLAVLGTYAAVSSAFGYSESTVQQFAQEKFGLNVKPRLSSAAKMQIVEDYRAGLTLPQIAAKHGASIGSVHRYVDKAVKAGTITRTRREKEKS